MKWRELNPQVNVLNILEGGISSDKRKLLGFPAGDEAASK
jgi:hypothetical protein